MNAGAAGGGRRIEGARAEETVGWRRPRGRSPSLGEEGGTHVYPAQGRGSPTVSSASEYRPDRGQPDAVLALSGRRLEAGEVVASASRRRALTSIPRGVSAPAWVGTEKRVSGRTKKLMEKK
jgi:hypothetical protein